MFGRSRPDSDLAGEDGAEVRRVPGTRQTSRQLAPRLRRRAPLTLSLCAASIRQGNSGGLLMALDPQSHSRGSPRFRNGLSAQVRRLPRPSPSGPIRLYSRRVAATVAVFLPPLGVLWELRPNVVMPHPERTPAAGPAPPALLRFRIGTPERRPAHERGARTGGGIQYYGRRPQKGTAVSTRLGWRWPSSLPR